MPDSNRLLDSIRLRLTLWHLLIVASLQIILGVCMYIFITAHLSHELDRILNMVLDSVEAALQQPEVRNPDHTIRVEDALRLVKHIETPIVIYNGAGQVLAERPYTVSRITPLLTREPAGTLITTIPAIPALHRGDRRIALRRFHDSVSGVDYFMTAGISLSSFEDELHIARIAFLTGVPFMLALTALGGWILTGWSLKPAVSMAERARTIGADNMTERLSVARPNDELGRLAASLNELLDRLAAASVSERQFMADAAHELRTPLSVVQTAVTVTLNKSNRPASEYLDTLLVVDRYIQRLTRSVNDVFRLARADAGFKSLQIESLYLDELVESAVNAARVLATQKGIVIDLAAAEVSPCRGDEALLTEMLLNLLENSIKYTHNGGRISVALTSAEDMFKILIADTGVGIDAADRDYIFQRFYRGRSAFDGPPERVEGTGLGLAIAHWIATSHHGTLELQASDENGSIFLICIPANQPLPHEREHNLNA
jgi:signal transduction histidine kinase